MLAADPVSINMRAALRSVLGILFSAVGMKATPSVYTRCEPHKCFRWNKGARGGAEQPEGRDVSPEEEHRRSNRPEKHMGYQIRGSRAQFQAG